MHFPRVAHLVLVVAVLVLLPDLATAQATRTLTRTTALHSGGHVELDTFTGSVRVTVWDQDRVEMEARIEGDDSELVDNTILHVEEEDDNLSVEVDYDEVKDSQEFLGLFSIGKVDRPAVHIALKMPRTATLTVDDFSSEISVEGLRADLTLDTFSSRIDLHDVEGRFDIDSFSGEISGDGLRGAVQLETFSGDVRIRMGRLEGNSHFETFSGDVELTVPSDAGFELVGDDDAFGELESDFALRAEEGRRIAGAGGPQIEVETFSGGLQLRTP